MAWASHLQYFLLERLRRESPERVGEVWGPQWQGYGLGLMLLASESKHAKPVLLAATRHILLSQPQHI